VSGAVHGLAECRIALTSEPLDVIVAGELPLWELASIVAAADNLGCSVLEVTTEDGLVSSLAKMATRRTDLTPMNALAARSKVLAFERERLAASPRALALRLQTGEPERARRGAQSLDLREWLPQVITHLRAVVPDYIELVPMVAADTLPVHCVPAVLEHVMFELVLRACTALPWGGTVWLTATPGADGEVKLEVLENGHGHVLDLSLRASPPAYS